MRQTKTEHRAKMKARRNRQREAQTGMLTVPRLMRNAVKIYRKRETRRGMVESREEYIARFMQWSANYSTEQKHYKWVTGARPDKRERASRKIARELEALAT